MKRFGSIFMGTLLSTTALTCMPAAAQTAPAGDAVEEIVVRGAYIPEPKRETSEISSFLMPEDFERSGDGDAAAALRRVTGISLVGGRFIYVRGLGERYSSALLNGMPLPSPEPLRRVAPLDLFPSSILESAAAQKTYSPQYSAEFGGGLVEIRTKAVPDARILELGVSFGGDTATTWRQGLMYDGGKLDFLGIDDGLRDIPDPLQGAIDANKRLNSLNFSSNDLMTIGRSLANSELWVLFEGTTPGNFGLDFTYGDRFLRGDASIGYLLNVGYDNGWSNKRGLQQEGVLGAGNQLEVGDDFRFQSTQNDVGVHALLGLGADWETTTLKGTSLLIRNTTKEARTQEGESRQFDQFTREDYLEWFERQLWTNQVEGTHRLADGDFVLSWKGSYSMASRDAPYERAVQYRDFGDGLLRYDFQRAQNLTRFSKIDDTLWSGAIDGVYTGSVAGRELILKAGYSYQDTERESQQRDYRYLALGGPFPAALSLSRVDYIFSDVNVNPNRFVLTEITGSASPPAYIGSLEVHGAYAGFDWEVFDYVRAAVGGRYETGDQFVDTFDYYLPNAGIDSQIDKSYWLPAATFTYNFAENMQMRFGGSQTIARPQFREIAPTDFTDPDTDRKFIGNPYLSNSLINNWDARWEWYFADQQYITVGGFYKFIKRPIEEIVDAAGDNLRTTFQNVPRAKLYGVEAEFKYTFAPAESGWMSTRSFFVASNYTYSKSEIIVRAGDIVQRASGVPIGAELVVTQGRPLQGHSKHLGNVQFGFEDLESGAAGTLLVNYSSKRIRAVGAGGPGSLPDIYEKPPISVDFTYNHPFTLNGGNYEFGFNVENILNEKYQATQQIGASRVDVDTYETGTAVSFSLKRTF